MVKIADDALLESDSDVLWHDENVPVQPRDRTEEAAFGCAKSRQAVKLEGISAYYLGNDGRCDLVATVEELAPDAGRFDPKKVTRYRVLATGISAVSGPVAEPFPDVEFERAIMAAARKALGGASVVPYDDGIRKVTLRGVGVGRCSARVRVLDGFDSSGDPLFEKVISFCRD